MEEKKVNKRIVFSVLAILLLVVVIAGATYAYFATSDSSGTQTIVTAEIDVSFKDTNIVRATDLIPLKEEDITEKATILSFKLNNNSNVAVESDISLTDLVIDDELKDSYFKWRLLENDIPIKEGDFMGTDNNKFLETVSLPISEVREYKLMIWMQESYKNQNSMQNRSLTAKVTVDSFAGRDYYKETGVNAPELSDGMIPVVYNETTESWVKADITKEWYNYSEQMWANAVTVTETNRTIYEDADPGTEISMEDINSMWVWIPRFKYKISSNMGSTTTDITNPSQIDVVFETGISTTGVDEETYRNGITSDGTNTNYYTHPAFRDGSLVYRNSAYDAGGWNYEIKGIWVGKFEPGTSTSACNNAMSSIRKDRIAYCKDIDPIIKPDIISVRIQDVSSQFLTALKFSGGTMDTTTGKVSYSGSNMFGLDGTTNSHMMKTTEWGAVAILSQSKYGKMGNSNYSGADKEVYINNSLFFETGVGMGTYTGRSGGAPSGSSLASTAYPGVGGSELTNYYGFYTYNNYLLDYNTNSFDITNKTTKYDLKGTGASTTGTVYGIYDMSGGTWEYTMGNWEGYIGLDATIDTNGAIANSTNFNGKYGDGTINTSGISMPEDKYYDHYTGTSSDGDITKDIAILGDGTWETLRWYSDYYYTVYPSYPWIARGGVPRYEAQAGVFASIGATGAAYTNNTWRAVLVP